MTEKKRNDQHDDSYYDELIKQRIGEALRNQSRKERLDLAQLEAWVEADRQKRRAKMKRILAIASCFIIICAGTFSLKFAFDDDAVATAGKNDNKVNEEGNNVVIKNNEEGVDENIGDEEIICKNWESIKDAKKNYSQLLVPDYIPDRYDLQSLSIVDNELIKKYKYIFTSNNESIEIKESIGIEEKVYYNYDRKIDCDGYEIFIIERNEKTALCKLNDTSITIIGELTDNEIVSIMDNLK